MNISLWTAAIHLTASYSSFWNMVEKSGFGVQKSTASLTLNFWFSSSVK